MGRSTISSPYAKLRANMNSKKPKAKVGHATPNLEAITLEFLNETRGWRNLTVLPLKKRSGGSLGLVFFNDKRTVHEANLFADIEEIRASPKHQYDSLEAIVADGWIID